MAITLEKQGVRLYRYVPGKVEFVRTLYRVERMAKPFGRALPVALRRVPVAPHPAFMAVRVAMLLYDLSDMPPVFMPDRQVEVPNFDEWDPVSDPNPIDLGHAGVEHWDYYRDWNASTPGYTFDGSSYHWSLGETVSPQVVDLDYHGALSWSDPALDRFYYGYAHTSVDPDNSLFHWPLYEVHNVAWPGVPLADIWTGPKEIVFVPGSLVLPPLRQADPNLQCLFQQPKTVALERPQPLERIERIVEVVRETDLEPATQPQPQKQPTRRAPAAAGEKERKVMPRSRAIGLALVRALDRLSESAEVVDSFYQALPADVRKRWEKGRGAHWAKVNGKWKWVGLNRGLADQAGQYGIDGADWKLEALWHNWHKVDYAQAIENVAKNELEDRVYGGIYKRLPVNVGQAVDPAMQALSKALGYVL